MGADNRAHGLCTQEPGLHAPGHRLFPEVLCGTAQGRWPSSCGLSPPATEARLPAGYDALQTPRAQGRPGRAPGYLPINGTSRPTGSHRFSADGAHPGTVTCFSSREAVRGRVLQPALRKHLSPVSRATHSYRQL